MRTGEAPGTRGAGLSGGDCGAEARDEPVAVKAGLFTLSGPPSLLAGRCRSCRRPHFPVASRCPYCSSTDVERLELSGNGRLWAWTAVTVAPPGYRGEVPYGLGVVELSEGLRVVTRLTESDPGRLEIGQPMRLVLAPLHVDEEGREVVSYAFSATEPSDAPDAPDATDATDATEVSR